MSVFIADFERSENSDQLFGIVGRALVIATRFDSMCKALARAIDLRARVGLLGFMSNENFDLLVEKVQ